MIAEAPASISAATLPANVAELMSLQEAVEYLTEAVGRPVNYSRVTSMLARNHPAVKAMKDNGEKQQGHWRFRLRDVRYAAEHWPRPVGPGPRPLRGRKRRSDWGTGTWQERRRQAAREARERKKGEQHGDDQPADT